MCCIAVDNTVKPLLIKQLIDSISQDLPTNLWGICALYGLLQIILVGAWVVNDYCITQYKAKFRIDIVHHFMERIGKYSYTFFQNQLTGTLTSKINDVFQFLPDLIFTLINPFGYFLLFVAISLFQLSYIDPLLALSLILWIIIFFTITLIYAQKGLLLNRKYAQEKSKIIDLATDYLNNMVSIKTFNTKDFEIKRFRTSSSPFIDISGQYGSYITWLYALLGIFTSIYATGFIAFLILGYQKNQVSPGDFALVVILNFTIINSIFELSHTLRDFLEKWGAVDHALMLLEERVDIADTLGASPLNIQKGDIIFESVKFHYQGKDLLFQDQSITIYGGQKIGLVGYSGSGKSTFAHLILRLYDVTDGRILINGQDIRKIAQDSLRDHIAMIPQDISLFHRTIMENIRYGRIEATDREVIEAAKKAHIHQLICALPSGYQSLIGECGVKLSGGERQRIAIARAILKNSPILILDEATSSLDSITERAIQESLAELIRDKTTIAIAHRLSTLLHMDRIIVFDHGQIVEDGVHTELLTKNGLYKTLWNAQIDGFLPD